jgi:hypothetical protein
MNSKELKSKLENLLNLPIGVEGDSVKVSVPNGSRSVKVQYINNIFKVTEPGFITTFNNLNDTVTEILEALVCRELFSKGFNRVQINKVISNLIK